MKKKDEMDVERKTMGAFWDDGWDRKTCKQLDRAVNRSSARDGTKMAIITRKRGRHKAKQKLIIELQEIQRGENEDI